MDRFIPIDELARILNVSDETIRNAITRGTFPERYTTSAHGNRVLAVKGWRVIRWKDELAGVSDGDEDAPEAMP